LFGTGSVFLAKQFGLASVELAAVVLLLRYWKHRGTWILVFLVFSAFALSQVWSLARGEHTCDCFGLISTAAISVLILDIFVAGLAFFFYRSIPSTRGQSPIWPNRVRSFAGSVVISTSIMLVISACSWILILLNAEYVVRGDGLATPSSVFTMAPIPNSEQLKFAELPIRNISSDPVTIVGVNETCAVRHGLALPVTLQPGEVLHL